MTRALFAGYDGSSHLNLWVTDGTAAGTSELTISGAYSGGLFTASANPDFTVLGGEVLFAGAADVFGVAYPNLWVTDGTSAGTVELTFSPNILFSGGLDPDFTVIGSRVVFEAVDTNAHTSLWVTDGTSPGTRELTVAGAYSNGLFVLVPDPDFTVFGTKILFAGEDATGGIDLWVTDGTSAGTHELTAVGANPLGLFGPIEVNPDFTVVSGRVLFDGAGSLGQSLWVTDGTSAGTTALPVSGADPRGLFSNGIFPDFAVLAGKALFEGSAANGFLSGLPGLWVTDGTAAGTSHLSVANAFSGGLFSAVAPNFTVLGSKALFEGEDTSGHVTLWVTDGTSAGTSELTVIGANPNGIFSSTNPDFTVLGSKILFAGEDTAGNANLWVTDGTSAGTSELTAAGAFSGGLKPFDITPFGSGKALFQGADASGNPNLWVTDGTSAGTSKLMPTGASSSGLSPSDITLLALPTTSTPVIMAPGLVRLALGVSSPVPGVTISVSGAGAARSSCWLSRTARQQCREVVPSTRSPCRIRAVCCRRQGAGSPVRARPS
jgi:ELWxxDGT repeat protein